MKPDITHKTEIRFRLLAEGETLQEGDEWRASPDPDQWDGPERWIACSPGSLGAKTLVAGAFRRPVSRRDSPAPEDEDILTNEAAPSATCCETCEAELEKLSQVRTRVFTAMTHAGPEVECISILAQVMESFKSDLKNDFERKWRIAEWFRNAYGPVGCDRNYFERKGS